MWGFPLRISTIDRFSVVINNYPYIRVKFLFLYSLRMVFWSHFCIVITANHPTFCSQYRGTLIQIRKTQNNRSLPEVHWCTNLESYLLVNHVHFPHEFNFRDDMYTFNWTEEQQLQVLSTVNNHIFTMAKKNPALQWNG